MKLNEDIFWERNQIVDSFDTPLRRTLLIPTDMADHKCQVEKVYKQMLHEASVIDECCRRFEKMFRRNDFYFIEVKDES